MSETGGDDAYPDGRATQGGERRRGMDRRRAGDRRQRGDRRHDPTRDAGQRPETPDDYVTPWQLPDLAGSPAG